MGKLLKTLQQSISTDVRLWWCNDCSLYRRAAYQIEAIGVVQESMPAAITKRHSRPYCEVLTMNFAAPNWFIYHRHFA